MKYPMLNIAIGKFGILPNPEEVMKIYNGANGNQGGKQSATNADFAIRAALNAGRSMTFATSQPASWKAHFTKRFPDAKIEEMEGGLRISK